MIFFSPVLGADVVNVIVARSGGKYKNGRDLMEKYRNDSASVEGDVLKMLEEMFPNARSTYFIPYQEWTHSSVLVDQKYWDQLMEKFLA